MLTTGDTAPLFCLPSFDGTELCLQNLLGSFVVVYFYPRDSTPGCTTEACDFSASLASFVANGACVLGISPDSMQSHQKFINKHALAITLLCDNDHSVALQYGAWGEKKSYGKTYEGILRSTFLIDKEGKIAFAWYKVKVKDHAKAVLDKLIEIRSNLA
ncbi:MAG: thioredoxin-dependent thiol peroxidase [Helicobacter sp.]|nr:thioredoxin-dependent thiol peroxidase [Helicobacter sp.]